VQLTVGTPIRIDRSLTNAQAGAVLEQSVRTLAT
jgi:hypothetical protein